MVLTKEYRIPLPLEVEEYRIAQLYMINRVSKQHTGNGEGIQVLENKPFNDENGSGQYTHKILHIGSKIPSWIKAMMPTSALQVDEKANAYPYCKTVYSCPFLGDRFNITITTKYLPDAGTTENAFNRTAAELKDRAVDVIDIANDPMDPAKYKAEEDPAVFVSKTTGRGKLGKDWIKTVEKPVMCSYKECSVTLRIWGVQTAGESYIHKVALRDVFFNGHRQAFCWLDEWFGKTIEDMRKMEDDTKAELDKLLATQDGAGPTEETA